MTTLARRGVRYLTCRQVAVTAANNSANEFVGLTDGNWHGKGNGAANHQVANGNGRNMQVAAEGAKDRQNLECDRNGQAAVKRTVDCANARE